MEQLEKRVKIILVLFCVFLVSSGNQLKASPENNSADELELDAGAASKEKNEFKDFDDIMLGELLDTVVTATKREQTVQDAPSIVEVISYQEIRHRGYRTVGEALRSVPGIAIIDDHLYWNVGMRGLYGGAGTASDIVKVMINGQPVSFRSSSANFFGYELLPIESVKRIEIVRGPGSALYGANAFLGVINIITFEGKDFGDKSPSLMVALGGDYTQNPIHGNFNGNVSLRSGWSKSGFQYLLSGTYQYSDRSGLEVPGLSDMVKGKFHRLEPQLYPEDEQGYPTPGWDRPSREQILKDSISRNDLERVGSLYGLLSYNIGESLKISLDSDVQYFDRFGEFQDFSYLTHRNRLTYLNWFVRSRFLLPTEQKDGFSMSLSLALAGGKPTADDHLADPLTSGTYKRRLFGYLAFDAALELNYAFSESHVITLGLDYTNDREDLLSMQVVNEISGQEYTEAGYGDKTFANFGIYAQWIFSPLKGLNLTLGTRLDNNSVIACNSEEWDCFIPLDDEVIPAEKPGDAPVTIGNRGFFQISNRAAIVYSLPFLGLYTKIIYGSSFKPPSPFQLYHKPINILGSQGYPYLKPQTADTVEMLLGDNPSDWLHVYANFYYTSVTDIVVFFKEGGLLQGRNADVSLLGLEGKIEVKWKQWLSGYMNVSYQIQSTVHPKRRENETDFAWSISPLNKDLSTGMYPSLMINVGLNFYFPEQYVNINLNGYFVGERTSSLANTQLYNAVDLTKTYSLDAYFLADITVSSVGLKFWGDRETIFSVSFRQVPGLTIEPGYGGIDIPALGPQLYLRIEQQF